MTGRWHPDALDPDAVFVKDGDPIPGGIPVPEKREERWDVRAIEHLQANRAALTAWELGFVDDNAEGVISFGRELSDKQRGVLKRALAKCPPMKGTDP